MDEKTDGASREKPMKRWDEVFGALGVTTTPSTAMSSIGGEVIPPNTNRETTIAPIKVHEREAARLFKAAEKRFHMDVCYCSVYDDCWIAHWQQAKVDPVARCELAGQPVRKLKPAKMRSGQLPVARGRMPLRTTSAYDAWVQAIAAAHPARISDG